MPSKLKSATQSLLDRNIEPTLEAFQYYFPDVVKDELQFTSVTNLVDWFKCKHKTRQGLDGIDVVLVPFERPEIDRATRKKSRKRAANRVSPSPRNEDTSNESLCSCNTDDNASLEEKSRECDIFPLRKKKKKMSITQEEHFHHKASPRESITKLQDTGDNSLVVKKGQSKVFFISTSTESNLDKTTKLRDNRSKPRMKEKKSSPSPFSKSILNIQESTSEASPPTLNSTDCKSSSDKAGARDDPDKRVNIHTDCNALATGAKRKIHSPDAIQKTREDLFDPSFRHDQNNTYSGTLTNESETQLDSMTNDFMPYNEFEENNNLTASSDRQYESATNISPSNDMSDELELRPLSSFCESSNTGANDNSGLAQTHNTSQDVTTMGATSSRASMEEHVAEAPVFNESDDPFMQGIDDAMTKTSSEQINLQTTTNTTTIENINTSLAYTTSPHSQCRIPIANPHEEENTTKKKIVVNARKTRDDETSMSLVQAQAGDFAATTTSNERDVQKETNTESKSGSMMSTATNNTLNMDEDQPLEVPVPFLKQNDAHAYEEVRKIIQAMVDEGIEHTGIEFRKKYPSMTRKYERNSLSAAICNFTRQKEKQLEQLRKQKIRREMINNSQTYPQMHQDYFSPHMHAFYPHSAIDPTYMCNQTAPIEPRTNTLPGTVGFDHPPHVYNGDYRYTMPRTFPGPAGFNPHVYNGDYRYTIPRVHIDSANGIPNHSEKRYDEKEGQGNFTVREENFVQKQRREECSESLQISNKPLNAKGSRHDEMDECSSDGSFEDIDDTITEALRQADSSYFYGEKYEAQEKHMELEAVATDSVKSNLGQEVTNKDEKHRSITIHDDRSEQSSSNDRDDHLDEGMSSKSLQDEVNASDSTNLRTNVDSAPMDFPSTEIDCEEINDDKAYLQHLEVNIDDAIVGERVETSTGEISENAVEVGEKNEVICLDDETSSNQSENHTWENVESYSMKSGGKTSSDRDQESNDIDQQYNSYSDDIARDSEIIFLDDDDDDDEESTISQYKDDNFEHEKPKATTSGNKKDSIFLESDSEESNDDGDDDEESTIHHDKDDDFENEESNDITSAIKNSTNNEDSTKTKGCPNSTHHCTSKKSNTDETAASAQRKVFDELLKRKAISLADWIFEDIIGLSSNWLECQGYAEELIKLGFYDEKMMENFCTVEIVDSYFASFMKLEHRSALKTWLLQNGTFNSTFDWRVFQCHPQCPI